MRHLNRTWLPLCVALVLAVAGCRGNTETGTTGTTTEGVRVTDVTLGRAIGGDKAVTDATDDFRPTDTIYASIATDGSAASTTLRALWTYEDGQVVDDSSRTIAPKTSERNEFHIAKPDGWPQGTYRLEILVNGVSARTASFRVA